MFNETQLIFFLEKMIPLFETARPYIGVDKVDIS